RPPLSAEAIRLTRLVTALLPGEPEAAALLALMLLQDSRRAARADTAGPPLPVPLTEQDRDRWDQAAIDEGLAILASIPDEDPDGEPPGPYRIQAGIGACHARAAQPGDTDWATIARLYAALAVIASPPVVELNRAVAVGMADGPAAGLAL